MRRLRRGILPVLLALTFVALLFVGVFPTRTFLTQRDALAASESELAELEAATAELETKVELLETPEEVERLARQDYGMVRPGEEPYRILPAPEEPVPVPGSWPFTLLAERFAP